MRRTRGSRASLFAGVLIVIAITATVAGAVFSLLEAAATNPAARNAAYDAYVWRVTRFTLWQASLSTVLSIVLAIPVARALSRRRAFFGRTWLLRLFAVPLGLPAIVVALGLIAIWGQRGIVNHIAAVLGAGETFSVYGLSGILLAHVFFNLPLAVRLIVPALDNVPYEHWRNAAQLGLSSATLFRLVEWPAIARVLPGLAGLIFMLCATSFTLVLLLGGGPGATTIEVAIYQSLRFDFDPPRAVLLALLQIALTGFLLALLALLPRAEESQTAGGAVRRFDGKTLAARTIDTAALSLAACFVAAPLAAVFVRGLRSDLVSLLGEATVLRAIGSSLGIAAAAAIAALVTGYAIVMARHAAKTQKPEWRSLHAILGGASSLILLVPPVVLGAGWFLALRQHVDIFSLAPVIVVTINALMALPFVVRVLENAHATHCARTDRLCASLGISGWTRFKVVDWPDMRRPIATAAAFAMALSLGDLGAIALFGGDDLTTLPYLLMQRMGSYRTEDAAGIALILTGLCLVFMIFGTPRAGLAGTAQGKQ